MITIDFTTIDEDGKDVLLARASMPAVPRKREIVALEDLRLRADEEKPLDEQRAEPEVMFEVIDVLYRVNAHFTFGSEKDAKGVFHKGEPTEVSTVTVYLATVEENRVWSGLSRESEPEIKSEVES